MTANEFVEFCLSLKEKFPQGINEGMFESALKKEKDMLNFIKKVVLKIDFNKNIFPHSDSASGLTQTPNATTTPVLPRCLGTSFPGIYSDFSLISSSDKITAPVLPMSLGFSSNVSEDIKRFHVNELDLQKTENYLAKKYKLDVLTVCNILINSELPNLNSKNLTCFNNCYFTLDKIEDVNIPCEWLAVRGGNGHTTAFVDFKKVGDKLQAGYIVNDVLGNKECFKLVFKRKMARCNKKYINFQYNLTSNSFSKCLFQFIGTPAKQC